jgi:hypothetical protein
LQDAIRFSDAYEATLIIRDSPPLLAENRRLYLRGDLIKLTGTDNSQSEPRAVFLFGDLLVHGRPNKDGTIAFRGQIELTTSVARASNTESNKRSHCFEIVAAEKQVASTMAMGGMGGSPNMLFSTGGLINIHVTHMFQARSREEQSMWVTEIQRLISACKERKAKLSSATLRQSSDVPPSLSRSTTSSSSSTAASGGDIFDLRGKPLYKKMNSKSSTRGINNHEFMP